jgi:outer membrane protein assembly factor BamB
MLPLPDLAGLVTCPSCGRVTRASSEAWPPPPPAAPDPATQWEPPPPLVGGIATVGTPAPPLGSIGRAGAGDAGRKVARSAGLGCGLASIVIFIVFAIGSVAILRSCNVDEAADRLDVSFDAEDDASPLSGSSTVLSSSAKATDVLMTTQMSEGTQLIRRLSRVRFTPEGAEQLWASEALDESSYRAEVAQFDDGGDGAPLIYAAIDDQLLALDGDTGATKWRTTLRDRTSYDCEDCFEVVDGTLIVRTLDAYVTAFGPDAPEPLWEKRLNSPAGSVSVANDRLFIVDEPESSEQLTAVQVVSPTTGRVARTVTPTCPEDDDTPWQLELSPGDPVHAVGETDDVVAAFGFGDVCLVRWNAESGTVAWTSRLINASGIRDQDVLVGDRDLVASTTSSALVAVDLTSGEAVQLTGPADTALELDSIVGRTLVATTATTRGTPRRGLAAWDLEAGERLWAIRLPGDPSPTSGFSSDALFDGSPVVELVPTVDGMTAFTFRGEDRTFAATPIDLSDGALGTEVRRRFLGRYDSGTPTLTIEGSVPDRLIISVDSVAQALPISGRGTLAGYPDVD